MGTLCFKSKEAYRKWLAYNYIHNRKKMGKPPHQKVVIRGKLHKVKHVKPRKTRKEKRARRVKRTKRIKFSIWNPASW